ncbi:MAG: sorbosone dehydrogenase family protein [Amaricoccus sp.]
MRRGIVLAVVAGALCACDPNAHLPVSAGIGPDPALPPPSRQAIPTVAIAPARGWPTGKMPQAAPGLQVTAFATGLDHPRWLLVLPDGDVLVAESNAQPKPPRNLREFFMKQAMRIAGAEAPSPDRIVLLRDTDGDGTAETRSVFRDGLTSPFGMALVGDALYVADTDALLRFAYQPGMTQLGGTPETVTALPAGEIDHHWTKGLAAAPGGGRLYVSVGSNSDHGENGIPAEAGRASIWEVDPATGQHRVLAGGLRNPVGLAFEPRSGALWTVVNERDELGGDLVPDFLTAVHAGAFYGWPYSYWGDHPDPRVQPARPDLVARARVPDYGLGPHGAPLGLAFAEGARLGPRFRDGAFIGQHGSWNRDPQNGYRVIYVPFRNGRPAGMPLEVLTGFLGPDGEARGRPVGVAIDATGALLVADDVGNAVWRVTAAPSAQVSRAIQPPPRTRVPSGA